MYKRIFLCFILVFISVSFFDSFAQSKPLKIKRKEFKKQDYGFKDAWYAVKDGRSFFSMGPAYYREAREQYLVAYNYNSENAELNYMIGKCYLFSDNKNESVKYFEKAFSLKPDVSFDIHLMLGKAFHQNLEFEKAILEYNFFISNISSRQKDDFQSQVNQAIQQCENGKLLAKEPKRVVIANLGKAVNSVFDDYGPVVSADGSKMYFTSRRYISKKSKRSILDHKYFEDVYSSQQVDGEWTMAKKLDKKITGKTNSTNIAVVGISPDMQKLYLYKGKENNGDLYVSTLKDNKW